MGRRFGFTVLVSLAIAIVLGGATSALAAAPPAATNSQIAAVHFENSSDTIDCFAYGASTPTSTAYWGLQPGSGVGASGGLWCGRTLVGSSGNTYPYFMTNTRGIADWQLPDATAYYSSTVSFSYSWPMIANTNDFAVRRFDLMQDPTVAAPPDINSTYHLPGGNAAFQTITFDRTSSTPNLAGNAHTVSNGPSWLQFLFQDGAQTGFTNQKGVTVDDLVASGIKFGPPRSVEASRTNPTTVHVTWTTPETHQGSGVAEADPTRYRIWYSTDLGSTWTELTSAGSMINGTSYDHTGTSQGSTYRYMVQAWDPAATSNGAASDPSAVVPSNTSVTTLTNSVSSSADVAYGDSVTILGSLTDYQSNPLSTTGAVVLQTSPTGGDPWSNGPAATKTVTTGHYSVTVASVTTAGYYRLHFVGDAAPHTESFGSALHITVHAAPTSFTPSSSAATQTVLVGYGLPAQFSATLAVKGGDAQVDSHLLLQRSADGVGSWTTTMTPTDSGNNVFTAGFAWPVHGDGYYRFVYDPTRAPADANHTGSISAVFHLMGQDATAKFVSPSGAAGGYGASYRLRAKLGAPNDQTGASGKAVMFSQSANGSAWSAPIAAYDEGNGYYNRTVAPTIRTYYKFSFSGAGDIPAATPYVWTAMPRAYLSVTSPPKVKHNVKFTVSGKVNRVPARRTVTIKAYRWEGKWVLRTTGKVYVGAGTGTTSYKLSIKAATKGTWRLLATVGDGYNASTSTGYRNFAVK